MIGLLLMSSCKVSADAIAASQQMTATAAALGDYYAALGASVTDTIALYELDAAISGIPFSDQDRKLPEETRAELANRKELAKALASLAAGMATLSSSNASGDVANAATRLENELITVKALPGGSPVPDAVGKAGAFLVQVVQQHEEKRAARAMDDTLKAVGDMFEKEKPNYDSIARTQIRQASQVAQDLINKNGVDLTPMLTPALKPFELAPLPPSQSLQASLRALALARLQSNTDQRTRKEEDASAAMLGALREMSSRIHLLATEKAMAIRGNPFSIKLVEGWAESWSASLI